MNSRHDNARLRASRRRAFTILELLVAVSVMTLVIYVLYALFNQTQMALRKNAAQVDVNEGGRAAMEMIVRELSQMEVSGYPAITDVQTLLTYSGSKSFRSRITPGNTALLLAYQSEALTPEGDDEDLAAWQAHLLLQPIQVGRKWSGAEFSASGSWTSRPASMSSKRSSRQLSKPHAPLKRCGFLKVPKAMSISGRSA